MTNTPQLLMALQNIADAMFPQFLETLNKNDIQVFDTIDLPRDGSMFRQQYMYSTLLLKNCNDVTQMSTQTFLSSYSENVFKQLMSHLWHKDVGFVTLQGPPTGYPIMCALNTLNTVAVEMSYDHINDSTFVKFCMRVRLGVQE